MNPTEIRCHSRKNKLILLFCNLKFQHKCLQIKINQAETVSKRHRTGPISVISNIKRQVCMLKRKRPNIPTTQCILIQNSDPQEINLTSRHMSELTGECSNMPPLKSQLMKCFQFVVPYTIIPPCLGRNWKTNLLTEKWNREPVCRCTPVCLFIQATLTYVTYVEFKYSCF